MKYIRISSPGSPDVLQPDEKPCPDPGPGQVLIKVAAAGINRMDILQRKGLYPPPPGASDIPGVEVAGEIVSIGNDTGDIKKGDRVCALLTGGGYAEYVLADAPLCLPVPAGLSLIEAASLPEALFTVWANVIELGKLSPGESFLVHGGSSGIGSMAIQVARAIGASVYTTAGSSRKCDYCRSLGAVQAINYREQDFVTACLESTGGNGIHVILDMVGGDYLPRNIRLAAEEGRIVMIAALGGIRSEVNILNIMQKRIMLTGSTLRSRPLSFKQKIAASLVERVWPLLEAGTVRPCIYKNFSFDQVQSAHALMEGGEHMGKIMLVTGTLD